MKFARYLQDTQTPEWKKAYIDYRGLKKLIGVIRQAQQTGSAEILPDVAKAEFTVDSPSGHSISPGRPAVERRPSKYGSTGITPPFGDRGEPDHGAPPLLTLPPPAKPLEDETVRSKTSIAISTSTHQTDRDRAALKPRWARTPSRMVPSEHSDVSAAGAHAGPSSSPLTGASRLLAGLRRGQSSIGSSMRGSPSQVQSLNFVYRSLTPLERQFFEKLDKELEKVEKFYHDREREAMIKATALKEQLRELKDHRQLFHEAKETGNTWTSIILPQKVADRLPTAHVVAQKLHVTHMKASSSKQDDSPNKTREGNGKQRERSPSTVGSVATGVRARLDPDDYKHAKKELKKAILQYYRGLELLNNYRVLNLTGFRKALKKFEKITRITVQQAYTKEKIETSSLSSGETIETMIKEIELLYAARFERGDVKRARTRLRAAARHKSHHFSTFRSGLYLGLAIPVFVDGLYQSFQPETREALPWDALLIIYAAFMIPCLFSLLVGINVWVWTRFRINYAFIFDLDVRSQLDSREYFELPAFLLGTLAYAFWLSFRLIGNHTISPTSWPLVWLVFAACVIVNPLPLLFPASRWWLVRKVSKLLISGSRPVEFADFWLGDQFCSLVFTLSNLYFLGCSYEQKWKNVWVTCSSAQHWGVPFALGALPYVARAVQSLKRYADSKLYTHLVNGGKYASSILFYLFFYIWRHQGEARNFSFVLFMFFGINYSVYNFLWDTLMDWSLFKRPAAHPFLRKDLQYPTYYLYYFAMISNMLLRFSWIIYIPSGSFSFPLRSFIAAMLEMFRRWQWNFYRLENEHIGNTDQYRVTKEVPLPYSFDDADDGTDDEGDEEDENYSTNSRLWRRRPVRMSSIGGSKDGSPRAAQEP